MGLDKERDQPIVMQAPRTEHGESGGRVLKVLLYSLNYAPELTGVGKYSGEMAEWLASRGHEVRVICGPPYYPKWRVWDGYRRWWYMREHRSGVGLWRCPLWVPRRPGGMARILHLFTFVATSMPALLRQAFWRPDIIVAIEPPFMGAPGVLMTAWLARARTWLHVQDLEVDAAFALGLLRAGWMSRLAFALERRVKAAFDGISTISGAMARRIREKLPGSAEILLVPNWVDTKVIRALGEPPALRAELGIGKDTIVALYSGNMGRKQGLEMIVEAARQLAAESDIVFVMCGDGVAAKELQQRSRGLQNIMWLALQPLERLNELLNLADIHLLPQREDAADLVMPSKLIGMMASGRPVVATAHPGTEVARAIGDAGCLTPPGDGPAFLAAISTLAQDRELRENMGKIARHYAEQHWEVERVLGSLEQHLRSVVGGEGYESRRKGES